MQVMHLMMSWLPAVLQKAGLPMDRAILGTVVLNVGGVLGSLLIGRLIDRYGVFRILPVASFCGAIAVALISMLGVSVGPLMLLLGITGASVIGAQIGCNSLSAAYYPVSARATGVGWALAAGRVGSVLGPLVGGVLIAWNVSTENIFLLATIPALVATLSLFFMGRVSASKES
jgi:AAHS family 4-hydroxybenzoate transporter-like MFS transporter